MSRYFFLKCNLTFMAPWTSLRRSIKQRTIWPRSVEALHRLIRKYTEHLVVLAMLQLQVFNYHTCLPLFLSRESKLPFVSPSPMPMQICKQTAFCHPFHLITRRLFVVTQQDGGFDENAGLHANLLLTDEQLVEKRGF